MNALESYRISLGLTYDALAAQAGKGKPSVWRHCNAKRIPADAVPGYEQSLGIPRWQLRPDLWCAPAAPAGTSTCHPQQEAV